MNALKPITNPATLTESMDRIIDRFFEPSYWPVRVRRPADSLWEPSLDFSETEKEFVLRLEAPGMARDDFDVDVDGNLLTLSGKRELSREVKGEDYLWQERQEGRFLRTIRLPAKVSEAKIDAVYKDGVLTVRLPKLEQAPKTKVAVK
ncbi:MAG: Hsp20/alpha crystallin family protein [Gemmatimonadales bacterium]|nr:Hsp20/alpha crystallin family protein [Gemmatimonadales bacterium]